jgi:hypothetical protein
MPIRSNDIDRCDLWWYIWLFYPIHMMSTTDVDMKSYVEWYCSSSHTPVKNKLCARKHIFNINYHAKFRSELSLSRSMIIKMQSVFLTFTNVTKRIGTLLHSRIRFKAVLQAKLAASVRTISRNRDPLFHYNITASFITGLLLGW